MSSNPFDLERAVDQLRSETPKAEATHRARQALMRPKQKSVVRPRVIAFGAVAVAAVALLWPRGATGAAWAQVAARTGGQTKTHTRSYLAGKSEPYSEVWSDGPKLSVTMYSPFEEKKRLMLWTRGDGVYDLSYSDFSGQKSLGRRFARKSKVKSKSAYYPFPSGILGAETNLIDDVLKQSDWKVLEQKAGVETPEGLRDRYKLKETAGTYSRKLTAYVDPETKLIRRIDNQSDDGKVKQIMLIDYPESIPAEVFKIEAPAGVEIRDFDKERADFSAAMKKGLGSKRVAGKTVVLRAAMQDLTGNVWVLWTGSGAPAGDLRNPVAIKGFHTGTAYGVKAFTSNWAKAPSAKPAPALGLRLGGMSVRVQQALRRATLTIPVLDPTGKKKLGTATFENVPIWPIQSIYDFAQELGLH